MGYTIRFTSYVGLISNGQIRFVTDETGATNIGEKAMAFSASDARDMVCNLVMNGSTSAVVVTAPQHNVGSTLYNPDEDIAFSDGELRALARKGFRRWRRGHVDRLYINAEDMGLKRTGRDEYEFEGERLDYWSGRQIEISKTYIDLCTGLVHSNNERARECAERMLNAVVAEWTAENPVA